MARRTQGRGRSLGGDGEELLRASTIRLDAYWPVGEAAKFHAGERRHDGAVRRIRCPNERSRTALHAGSTISAHSGIQRGRGLIPPARLENSKP